MPGNSASRLRAMATSCGTKAPSPRSTNRGSTSRGTFTRANSRVSFTGSRTHTPRLSDRFEMYGNGRPGPTASGVSTGKICSVKIRSSASVSASDRSSPSTIRMPWLGQRGPYVLGPLARVAVAQLAPARGDPLDRLRVGDRPSALRTSMPASTWSCSPATRTISNSSRLDV